MFVAILIGDEFNGNSLLALFILILNSLVID